jgi:hypothetical protein
MDFTDAIDGTHDELVDVSAEKQIHFEPQGHQNDVPNELTALIADL